MNNSSLLFNILLDGPTRCKQRRHIVVVVLFFLSMWLLSNSWTDFH